MIELDRDELDLLGYDRMPNFGKLEFSSGQLPDELVLPSQTILSLIEKIKLAGELKPKSITCLIGSEGIGKSTVSKAIECSADEFVAVQFDENQITQLSQSSVSDSISTIISKITSAVDASLSADVKKSFLELFEKIAPIDQFGSQLSILNSIIDNFSEKLRKYNEENHNRKNYVIVDGLESMDKFYFHFVLKIIHNIVCGLNNVQVTIVINPIIRQAMRSSSFRGPGTDIVVVENIDRIAPSSRRVLDARFAAARKVGRRPKQVFTEELYQLIDAEKSKKTALKYAGYLFSFSLRNKLNNIDDEYLYSNIIESLHMQENRKNYILGENIREEFDLDLLSAGFRELERVRILEAIFNSQTMRRHIREIDDLETQLVHATFQHI